VLVDAAHGNSRKDHAQQRDAFHAALSYYAAGNTTLLGLSLESNLFAGKQPLRSGDPLRYGVSITDPCIGWEETHELILEASQVVAATFPHGHDAAPTAIPATLAA
jgi:3-deoxy-7-phosphoheptulonate synthase